MIAALHKITKALESSAVVPTEIELGKGHLRNVLRPGFAGTVLEPKAMIVVFEGFLLYCDKGASRSLSSTGSKLAWKYA